MWISQPDRRAKQRVSITDTELSLLAFAIPVRLLDISTGGVMLESTLPVDLGSQGTLRFDFAGEPFSTDVKVERLDQLASRAGPRFPAGQRFSIGATFVALSRQDQRVIERFADK